MRKKARSIRKVVNESGTIADRVRLNVKVLLDLGDPQNIVDGTPDLKFSLGGLRFENNGKRRISPPTLSQASRILAGAGIQTTMRLSGPGAFTFISVIKEVHIGKADLAA